MTVADPHSMSLFARLRGLTDDIPPDLEISRLLSNLADPANDELSKDRYTALVAAGAVEEGLRAAIERKGQRAPTSFDARIKRAESLGIVTTAEAAELHKLRLVRNIFAHSLAPIGFNHPTVIEATRSLWDHPVTDFAGYFAPAFEPREHFAVVCGEFFKALSAKI